MTENDLVIEQLINGNYFEEYLIDYYKYIDELCLAEYNANETRKNKERKNGHKNRNHA